MVFQQCGPVCPQTCDTDESVDCSGGCVEGCFCPSRKVLSNGQCINAADCQGTVQSKVAPIVQYNFFQMSV